MRYGELALIQRIRVGMRGRNEAVRLGIGDDCAVLRVPAGCEMVVTTDLCLEGRHFRRDWHSAESVGHRCLTRGLSDVAAMGARPLAAFLSLALPSNYETEWVDGFLRGLGALAERFGVELAGGDTSEAPGAEVLADVMVVGAVKEGLALRRSGAKVGDLIYITGELGGAAVELAARAAGAVGAERLPNARVGVGMALVGMATACMDLSDGISTDLRHLCEASGVGAELMQGVLPLAKGATLEQGLHGGEDYELLFTTPPGASVPGVLEGVKVTLVGRIVEGEGVSWAGGGEPGAGWVGAFRGGMKARLERAFSLAALSCQLESRAMLGGRMGCGYAGEMREATRIVRAGLARARAGEPLHAGPVFAAPFQVAGDPAGVAYTYGRSHNPTWTELEHAIGLMEGEGAKVRVFGSGLAAVAAVFGAVLRPGDTIAVQEGAYFAARQLLEEVHVPAGVKVRMLAVAKMSEATALEGVRLAWIETPSNPRLEVVDIEAVAQAAHAVGALLAVDNTTASPYAQKPLKWGADVSVCSDSKAMGGHSDLLMGHVAVVDSGLLLKVDRQRTLVGGIAGPMEAWLMLRSLATLPLRLERSSANALAVAKFLAGRTQVEEVLYPGLERHPGHATARRQMEFFGPVLGFTLRSKDAAERFLRGV